MFKPTNSTQMETRPLLVTLMMFLIQALLFLAKTYSWLILELKIPLWILQAPHGGINESLE
jgi:hypothetical protein